MLPEIRKRVRHTDPIETDQKCSNKSQPFWGSEIGSKCPDWAPLQNLPGKIGITGYRQKEHDVWLLDVWECASEDRWPMSGWFLESDASFVELPSETAALLGQLSAIATVLSEVDPVYGLAGVSWSAAISSLLGMQVTFYAANDETLNMAMVWNHGGLQAMRLTTGRFLITNASSSNLMVQQILNSEDDAPWECPPEVHEALRNIPGVVFGTPLTVESGAVLHSNAIALWPIEAASAMEVLGIGGTPVPADAWEHFTVEFDRPGLPASAMRPVLEFPEILDRAQGEARGILKTNRRFDPEQPLSELGFDDIDAMQLVLALEQIYRVKIPDVQLVEQGTMEQSLTLHRLAELVLVSSALPTEESIELPTPLEPEIVATRASANLTRWLWAGFWIGVFALVGGIASLLLVAGPVVKMLQAQGIVSNRDALLPLAKTVPFIAAGIAVFQSLHGRLPGTKHKR